MEFQLNDEMLATAMASASEAASTSPVRPHFAAFGDQSDVSRFTPIFIGHLVVSDGFRKLGIRFEYQVTHFVVYAGGSPKTVKVVVSDQKHLQCVTEPLEHDAIVAVKIQEDGTTIKILGVCSKREFRQGLSIEQFPLSFQSLEAFDKE